LVVGVAPVVGGVVATVVEVPVVTVKTAGR